MILFRLLIVEYYARRSIRNEFIWMFADFVLNLRYRNLEDFKNYYFVQFLDYPNVHKKARSEKEILDANELSAFYSERIMHRAWRLFCEIFKDNELDPSSEKSRWLAKRIKEREVRSAADFRSAILKYEVSK